MNHTDKINSQELRKFGITTGSIVAILFGLIFPWLFNFKLPYWPWIIFTVLVSWALIFPASLKPVYQNWMKFGNALGWINSRIILGIMFYLVFLPTAIILKILGKDPLHKKIEEKTVSYRINTKPRDKKHIERPF